MCFAGVFFANVVYRFQLLAFIILSVFKRNISFAKVLKIFFSVSIFAHDKSNNIAIQHLAILKNI